MSFPLQLDWRRSLDMPFSTSIYIQSVEVDGTVYVGGGDADKDENGYIVMAYSMQSCKWHTLPPYSARYFAMTTINNKLILVGGYDGSVVDQLGVWKTDSNQWIRPFPPMPTPRFHPSATSYKHWLVVAGGRRKGTLSTVEVLDIDNKQWSTALSTPSTPIQWYSMKSTVIGDTWYLMGGCTRNAIDITDVYSVSLEALVSHSPSDSSKIWNKIAPLNCYHSSPLSLGGSLLALGGYDIKKRCYVSTIQRYVPETNTWVPAGELPHPLQNCTCIMTAGRLHVLGGYSSDGKLSSYYFSDIE